MNELFVVTARTAVPDGGGGSTYTTQETTVSGYLWSLNGREAGADQLKSQGSHRVALPLGTDVASTATITQVATGKVYNVIYPFPTTAYSTSVIVGVEDA